MVCGVNGQRTISYFLRLVHIAHINGRTDSLRLRILCRKFTQAIIFPSRSNVRWSNNPTSRKESVVVIRRENTHYASWRQILRVSYLAVLAVASSVALENRQDALLQLGFTLVVTVAWASATPDKFPEWAEELRSARPDGSHFIRNNAHNLKIKIYF